MSKPRPIVDRLLTGEECDLSRIDDEIDAWHMTDTSIPLHEWLGFTSDEYQLYVEKPLSLRIILAARDHKRSLEGLLSAKDACSLVAARGASPAEVMELKKWLNATGRS
jgi:hypothetical protein